MYNTYNNDNNNSADDNYSGEQGLSGQQGHSQQGYDGHSQQGYDHSQPLTVETALMPELAEADPWERMPDEPVLWFTRFRSYLKMGPHRSFRSAARQNGIVSDGFWNAKAHEWNWKNRAEAWDEYQERLALERNATVMQTGFALDYERVAVLKTIAERESQAVLETLDQVIADPNAYSGGLSRRYEIVKGSFDKTLEALAQETGGRVKRVSVQRDLRDYAIALAKQEGYDESVAIEIAKLVAGEALN